MAPGPVLIMMRHASIIDNTIPDTVVGRAHGLGPALRAQARAADDPDDRHRRALGADELRAPRLGRHGRRAGPVCASSGRTSTRTRGSSSTPRGRARRRPSWRGRSWDRRAPAGDRAARRSPCSTCSRRASVDRSPCSRSTGDRRGLLRPRRPRRVRADLRHLARRPRRRDGPRALLALPGGRDADRPRRRRSPGCTSAGRRSTTGSASSGGSSTRRGWSISSANEAARRVAVQHATGNTARGADAEPSHAKPEPSRAGPRSRSAGSRAGASGSARARPGAARRAADGAPRPHAADAGSDPDLSRPRPTSQIRVASPRSVPRT